ncbi:MAG: hypothetical protein Q9224_003638, partial [Gallowayella concinna]
FLLSCFLIARKIFLSHTLNQPHENGGGKISEREDAWKATKVLTLWEPNWYTAWAFRRRWLLSLRIGDGVVEGREMIGEERLQEAVRREMEWVETLVTSPLDGKHAKSSWVWAHRMWVVRTFPGKVMMQGQNGENVVERGGMGGFVKKELEIVMGAGERHARDYHAWEYGRQVIRMTSVKGRKGEDIASEGSREMVVGAGLDENMWEKCTRMTHHWCLMHPRDISGWAFLIYMLDQMSQFRSLEQKERKVDTGEVVRNLFHKTQAFVTKYDWKGESIECFLKSNSHFQVESND